MALRIDTIEHLKAPRWVVCCWVASLHCYRGRADHAEQYLIELVSMSADSPWEWSA